MFKYNNGYFTNIQDGRVFTVKDRKDIEAQPVHVEKRYGGRNAAQIWKVVYTNAMGDEAYDKTGETDNQFGFKVNTPFLMRSRLPMQRVMECYGASYTSQKVYYKNRKAQLWTFDPVSKTIRNKNWTNYAWSVSSDWLRCQPMNSRWF
jgi:hypothetical protein